MSTFTRFLFLLAAIMFGLILSCLPIAYDYIISLDIEWLRRESVAAMFVVIVTINLVLGMVSLSVFLEPYYQGSGDE